MLEVRNLNKIYKTKKGLKYQALSNINLKFEEKGLVFILGKSGSGKSTLLNVMGGLDKYDSGEIIIKGKSSLNFKNTDFDSYRNTYVGFIFQEFYIIEDFTVEQNIGLALKLQHKKADPQVIEDILRQVDLAGYGQRKPNELSGGQKQRVAIARALIKNPQIIMADEPTGALDSNTGKQVFETLKKLSKEKLVLVVSHDRESAEKFADRIVELADGQVISDLKRVGADENSAFVRTEKYEYLANNYLHIKSGSSLTQEEQFEILKIIARTPGEVFISVDATESQRLHKEHQYNEETSSSGKTQFIDTKTARNDYKNYSPADFKVIKSRLPFKEAFKMGASNLKRKRIRLAFTIILSMVAFVLFGLSDTFASFNAARSLYDGLEKSNITRVGIMAKDPNNDENDSFYNMNYNSFSSSRIQALKGVFDGSLEKMYKYPYNDELHNMVYRIVDNYYSQQPLFYYPLFNNYFNNPYGFTVSDFSRFKSTDFATVNSKVPEHDDEILITDYCAEMFIDYPVLGTLTDKSQLVGKTIIIAGCPLKIAGILKTGLLEMEGVQKLKTTTDSSIYRELYEAFERFACANETIYVKEGLLNLIDLAKITNNDLVYLQKQLSVWSNSLSSAGKIIDNDKYLVAFKPGKTKENLVKTDYLKEVDLGDLAPELYDAGLINNYIIDRLNTIGINPNTVTWTEYRDAYMAMVTKPVLSDYIEYLDIDIETRLIDSLILLNNETITVNDNKDTTKTVTLNFAGCAIYVQDGWENQIIEYILSAWKPSKVNWQYSSGNYPDIWQGWQDYNYFNFNKGDLAIYLTPEYFNELMSALPVKPNEPYKIIAQLSGNFIKDMKLLSFITEPKNHFDHDTPLSMPIKSIQNTLDMMKLVFLYISIAFCVFAALMLMNFISMSVTNKKKEIGILRALGSKQSDVFKVFLIEGLLIALIELVLSYAAVIALLWWLNGLLGEALFKMLSAFLGAGAAINFNLFFFGIRQIFLMAALAVGVVVLASFIPVKKIASMRPIDAIKDK